MCGKRAEQTTGSKFTSPRGGCRFRSGGGGGAGLQGRRGDPGQDPWPAQPSAPASPTRASVQTLKDRQMLLKQRNVCLWTFRVFSNKTRAAIGAPVRGRASVPVPVCAEDRVPTRLPPAHAGERGTPLPSSQDQNAALAASLLKSAGVVPGCLKAPD